MACFFLFATVSPLSACRSTLPEFPCSTRVAGWRLSVVDLLCQTYHTGTDIEVSVFAQTLFCRPLPCDARVSARVHGTSFGDTSARSIVLSVSPCRVPGCVGLAVDTGVKRTSLSAASSAHPCWLVPCWSHRLDRALKSPHIIIVSPSSSSISSRKSQLAPVMQVEGWMYALMRIRDLWTTYPSSVRILSC